MKIFCVEVKDIPQFYIKTETSQIRNNEPLYVPFFCEDLRYEFGFAVKINRVVKAIGKDFAARCWTEYSVVTNFWSEDMLCRQRETAAPLDIAYGFDRSFALENNFHVFEDGGNISASAYVNDQLVQTLDWNAVCDKIDGVISYLSSYITLKIGDVIMIKTDGVECRKAVIGDRIEVKINEEIILETIIK